MMPDSRKIRLILDLRSSGVTDARVLSAMERIPREIFTPKAFRDHAYENVALPIGYEQTLSQTVVVGQMSGLESWPADEGFGNWYRVWLSGVCVIDDVPAGLFR